MTVEQRRARIVDLLKEDARSSDLAGRISRCRKGQCRLCGDLCPVKAQKWADENVTKIVDLLTSLRPAPVVKLRYTRGSWARKDGELALRDLTKDEKQRRLVTNDPMATGQAGVEKALRRAFDKINDPNVFAVGMRDAWYGPKSWEIGVSLIVTGVTESKLRDIFPSGYLVIDPISEPRESLRKLLAESRRAKLLPPLTLVARMPKRRQLEYLAWLAGMKPNERLFRYGCDRYFNRLEKTKRVSQIRPKKPHPFPFWLQHHWFGYHHRGCLCRACGGPGKRSGRR
jgi:hypothetical protein